MTDDVPTVIHLNGQPDDGKRIAAVYRCRLAFEDLAETDHPAIRFCGACQQKVFRIDDFDGFEQAVASKGCVWGSVDIRNQAPAERRMFLGMVAIDYQPASTLQWDE